MYLYLKQDQKFHLRFFGTPKEVYKHYHQGSEYGSAKFKVSDCPRDWNDPMTKANLDDVRCPLCAMGNKPAKRYLAQTISFDHDQKVYTVSITPSLMKILSEKSWDNDGCEVFDQEHGAELEVTALGGPRYNVDMVKKDVPVPEWALPKEPPPKKEAPSVDSLAKLRQRVQVDSDSLTKLRQRVQDFELR